MMVPYDHAGAARAAARGAVEEREGAARRTRTSPCATGTRGCGWACTRSPTRWGSSRASSSTTRSASATTGSRSSPDEPMVLHLVHVPTRARAGGSTTRDGVPGRARAPVRHDVRGLRGARCATNSRGCSGPVGSTPTATSRRSPSTAGATAYSYWRDPLFDADVDGAAAVRDRPRPRRERGDRERRRRVDAHSPTRRSTRPTVRSASCWTNRRAGPRCQPSDATSCSAHARAALDRSAGIPSSMSDSFMPARHTMPYATCRRAAGSEISDRPRELRVEQLLELHVDLAQTSRATPGRRRWHRGACRPAARSDRPTSPRRSPSRIAASRSAGERPSPTPPARATYRSRM